MILTLTSGQENFCVPAGDVSEVLRVPPLTRCPFAPPGVMGLANLRGRVLPVISLAGATPHENPAARVVVVEKPFLVGIFVESMPTLTQRAQHPPPPLPRMMHGDRAPPAPHRHAPEAPVAEARPVPLVVFAACGQDYALNCEDVREIMPVPDTVTAVADTGPEMLGVVEWRGALLPVASLRALLGLPPPAACGQKDARIVVTRIGMHEIGVLVDRVRPIFRAPLESIEAVPPVLMRGLGEARIGALCRRGDGRLLSVLSPNLLFEPETVTRLVSAGDSEPRPAQIAPPETDEAENLVGFRLGAEEYGILAKAVDQVVRCPDQITRVPHAPDFLLGLINVRGRAVPLIDQRARFGAKVGQGTPPFLLIVSSGPLQAALCFDGGAHMLRVPRAQLSPVPALSSGGGVTGLVARIEHGGRMIILIDAAALLGEAARAVVSLGAPDMPG